jgi:hypothetical protein
VIFFQFKVIFFQFKVIFFQFKVIFFQFKVISTQFASSHPTNVEVGIGQAFPGTLVEVS